MTKIIALRCPECGSTNCEELHDFVKAGSTSNYLSDAYFARCVHCGYSSQEDYFYYWINTNDKEIWTDVWNK